MLWCERSQMTFIRVTTIVKRLQKTQIRMETLHVSWFMQNRNARFGKQTTPLQSAENKPERLL